jgi:hypothetical protein
LVRRLRVNLMATSIYLYCPSGEDGAIRADLEIDIENFFGRAAENVGGGGGTAGFNIDFELAPSEDVESWVARLRDFLPKVDARPGTYFEVFPDGWQPGQSWRRVDLRGGDRWLTERETR